MDQTNEWQTCDLCFSQPVPLNHKIGCSRWGMLHLCQWKKRSAEPDQQLLGLSRHFQGHKRAWHKANNIWYEDSSGVINCQFGGIKTIDNTDSANVPKQETKQKNIDEAKHELMIFWLTKLWINYEI